VRNEGRRQALRQAGAWLKDLRKKAGLTQQELAARTGIRYYTYISQIEGGYCKLPPTSMGRWAAALGVPVAKFARQLLLFYEPQLFRLLFNSEKRRRSRSAKHTA
jgi:transcriptional regulator with XRE-family HTH domain